VRSLAKILCGALLISGCASDKYLQNPGHAALAKRDWGKAAAAFDKDANVPGANQLLFMLDQGTALFAAGRYKEAIAIFLRAEKLAEIKDYTSISEEVGTLLTSDNVRGYKGEDFEKVLINVYLALAFAAQGEIEGAQVEARKINLLLYRMIHEGKRNYEESPFARYLSGMLWESSGNWNDAYIDYKKTWELDPKFPDIGDDLISSAKKMRFTDEEKDWKKKFPEAKIRGLNEPSPVRGVSNEAELVVFFEKGLSPVKVPRGEDSSLPRYVSRYSNAVSARLKVNGSPYENFVPVLDVTALSTRYLEDRIGRMMAAKVAGLAVKGALAYGIAKATKSDDAGILAFVALAMSDRADLRCWRSLPGEIRMARLPLRAGTYDVTVEILGWSGEVIGTQNYPKLELKPGKKQFLIAR